MSRASQRRQAHKQPSPSDRKPYDWAGETDDDDDDTDDG